MRRPGGIARGPTPGVKTITLRSPAPPSTTAARVKQRNQSNTTKPWDVKADLESNGAGMSREAAEPRTLFETLDLSAHLIEQQSLPAISCAAIQTDQFLPLSEEQRYVPAKAGSCDTGTQIPRADRTTRRPSLGAGAPRSTVHVSSDVSSTATAIRTRSVAVYHDDCRGAGDAENSGSRATSASCVKDDGGESADLRLFYFDDGADPLVDGLVSKILAAASAEIARENELARLAERHAAAASARRVEAEREEALLKRAMEEAAAREAAVAAAKAAAAAQRAVMAKVAALAAARSVVAEAIEGALAEGVAMGRLTPLERDPVVLETRACVLPPLFAMMDGASHNNTGSDDGSSSAPSTVGLAGSGAATNSSPASSSHAALSLVDALIATALARST